MSRYTLDVTINWKDGSDNTIYCHPNSLYNLKKVIGEFIQDSREASSFMFTVVKNEEDLCDSHGREYLLVQDGKEGVIVECRGFPCMNEGEEATLLRDNNGSLFFCCADGHHHIKGQLNFSGTAYVGLYNVKIQDGKGEEKKPEATGT